MNTQTICRIGMTGAALAGILSLALAATAARAAEPIAITKDLTAVQSCAAVGQVRSYPPYFLPGADLKDVRRQAAALGADTILVLSRAVVTSGVAYRCAK